MLIWASIGAAAAGIVAVAVLTKLRHVRDGSDLSSRLRDVQDVLTDINRKIQDIEEHLPAVVSGQKTEATRRMTTLSLGNGTPVP